MFFNNQILNDCYQILQPIGSGGSSSVYLAYHLRLQKYVVIKKIKGHLPQDFLMRTEVDTLKNLHHPGLPQVYDFIQEQGSVYTVIDYVDGSDLDSFIQNGYRFTEQQLKKYLRQIADVLVYLHSQNPAVIHADIKPGNIIIDGKGNAVLIDFNTSVGENQGNLLGLTLRYASPEQLQLARMLSYGQAAGFNLDPRSDLFSLGATFYELITGRAPVPDRPPKPLHTLGISGYSPSFLMLIDSLLHYDREKRIKSAKKLAHILDRMDGSFVKYLTLRCASILLCATMISAGLYCWIQGAGQQVREDCQSQLRTVQTYISGGYLEQAQQLCDTITADAQMQQYLQKNPQSLAQLYHAMGDIAYYTENYPGAAAYYGYAIDCSDTQDPQAYAVYLRDAAIANAQAGDLQRAQQQLDLARGYNAGASDLMLIEVVIRARQSDTAGSLALAEQLLQTCTQPDICVRAAICAASIAPDVDSRITWLQRAGAYDMGRSVKRGLAAAYAEKANGATSDEKTQALQQAQSLYQELNQSQYASTADRLNYAAVLKMAGEPSRAIQVLEQAQTYDPNNYRIPMELCFVYHELQNSTKASEYCRTAITSWRSYTGLDKLSESSEQIQNLLELGRRYGIGG